MTFMPDFCFYCLMSNTNQDHWYWMKDTRYIAGGKWRCKQQRRDANTRYRLKIKKNPARREKRQRYFRQYHKSHTEIARFKAMLSFDKKRFFRSDIDIASYRSLISRACYYCRRNPAGGLDRVDNSQGHVLDNVLPCCEKCNNILGDLPFAAKDVLKSALRKINKQKLLENWTIPTKRGHSNV